MAEIKSQTLNWRSHPGTRFAVLFCVRFTSLHMLCFLLDPIGLFKEKFVSTTVLLVPSIVFLLLKWQPCLDGKYQWQRSLIFLIHFVIIYIPFIPLLHFWKNIYTVISVYSHFSEMILDLLFRVLSKLSGLRLPLNHLGHYCEFSESFIHSIYVMKLTSKFRVRRVYMLSYTVYVWCAMWWELIDNNRPRDPPLSRCL